MIVVAIGLLGAFVALVVASWVLGKVGSGPPPPKTPARLDVIKLALTVVGARHRRAHRGVQAAKDLEHRRFTERFGAAAAQLGASTPAERLAGVYAMAGVADRYTPFAQQHRRPLWVFSLPFDPDPNQDAPHSSRHPRHRRRQQSQRPRAGPPEE